MWTEARTQVVERLTELSEAFTGTKALSRVGKDDQLQKWFSQLADQVASLDIDDSNACGRKMHHLIAALSEVEQFHQIESFLQMKQARSLCARTTPSAVLRRASLPPLRSSRPSSGANAHEQPPTHAAAPHAMLQLARAHTRRRLFAHASEPVARGQPRTATVCKCARAHTSEHGSGASIAAP